MRKEVMDAGTEDEKLEPTALLHHILTSQNGRNLYNDCVRRSREDPGYTHYTFDFSQNISLPQYSRQAGPIYYLFLRKIQLFGFRIDGTPRQLKLINDEDQTIGADGKRTHGPDVELSMADWVLETYGANMHRFSIHADNCPGHARCHVDAGFANVKKLYRRTDCETMSQLEDIVNKSSLTNLAVRYPNWQWRNWRKFLDEVFKPLKNISMYQYFRFSSADLGVVTVLSKRVAPEVKVQVLKSHNYKFVSAVRPAVISPAGSERLRYLSRSVRLYIRSALQENVCSLHLHG